MPEPTPPTFSSPREAKASAKATKAHAKALRPWYAKKRWILSGGLVALIVIAAALGPSESDNSRGGDADTPAAQSKSSSSDTSNDSSGVDADQPEEPEMTSGQANALKSAENYLDLSGMSKKGLISQLSSSAGDGFSRADATFAANHVDADWNAEAVEAAKNYLDISPMSKSNLIEQLSSSAGDKFTEAQARYAADKVY